MEKNWDRNDKIFMLFFTILFCGIIALIAKDFTGIVTDIWFGFGSVMMEFGRVIEQLPV